MLYLCPATACFQGPAKVWGTLHGSRWVRMVGGHSSWLLPTQDDGPGVKKTLTRKLAPAPLQSRKACVMGVWGGQQGAGPHLQVPPQDAMRWGLGFPFALGQGSSPGVCCGHASWPLSFKPVSGRILVPSLTVGTRRSETPLGLFAATSTSQGTFLCSTLSQTLWGVQKSALPQQR